MKKKHYIKLLPEFMDLEDEDIDLIDINLLSIIYFYCNPKERRGCFASTEHLCKMLRIKKSRFYLHIQKLKHKKLIIDLTTRRNKRELVDFVTYKRFKNKQLQES